MVIQIPVGFQPIVGQKQEFRVTGVVNAVERDEETGQWLVTLEITDPMLKSYPGGFSNVSKDRALRLREEIRGG